MSSAKSATSICRMNFCAMSRGSPRLSRVLKHSASLSAACVVTATRSFSKGGFGLPGARNSSGPQRSGKSFSASVSLRRVEVGVEIINAELVEVAEHDVARAIRHEARPIIKGLAVMFLEILAALFHLH